MWAFNASIEKKFSFAVSKDPFYLAAKTVTVQGQTGTTFHIKLCHYHEYSVWVRVVYWV